jgi:hypothetical protein
LAAWIGFASFAAASLTPRKESLALGTKVRELEVSKVPARAEVQKAAGGTGSDFVVTPRTEILLNGKTCKYEDVPAQASIVRMEVAADKKTVLKIYFRTPK